MRISGWSSYVCSSDLGIVISPGPCDPDRAGICVELVERLAPKVPMLGVCLGHQAIGQVFGGVVRRGPVPMHGKVSTVHTDGKGQFEGLPGSFEITRHHSLVVGDARWPTVDRKRGGEGKRVGVSGELGGGR